MKCTKKVVAFTLATAMLFSNAIGVLATDTDVDTTDNKITFENGGGGPTTPPVIPEIPDTGGDPDPDKEVPTGNTGALRLDYVPQFDFGTQSLTTGAKTYWAELPEDQSTNELEPYFVQVTDLRGTGAGWSVNAQMTTAFSDGTHTLDGAAIELKNVANASQAGTTVPSTATSGTLSYVSGGSSLKIASAAANEGMGVTAVRFGNTAIHGTSLTADTSVELTIPATTQIYANKYSATIKWTLGATP